MGCELGGIASGIVRKQPKLSYSQQKMAYRQGVDIETGCVLSVRGKQRHYGHHAIEERVLAMSPCVSKGCLGKQNLHLIQIPVGIDTYPKQGESSDENKLSCHSHQNPVLTASDLLIIDQQPQAP